MFGAFQTITMEKFSIAFCGPHARSRMQNVFGRAFMQHPAPWSGCLVNSSQTLRDECTLSGVFIAINKAPAKTDRMQPNSSPSLTGRRAHEYACNLFFQHKLFVFGL